MVKVSVIVPVYNSSKYLIECLDSICNQTLKEIEIILLDDNSTDRSLEIMKSYEKSDSRVKVITFSTNVGPAVLRNVGMKYANGDYIAFVDSDDFIEPNMFMELYNNIKNTKAEIICSDFSKEIYGVDYLKLLHKRVDDGKINCIDPKKKISFLIDQTVSCWNKLYRHDFIKNFDFPNIKYEDYPTVVKMIGTANNIFTLNRSLYHYRIRPNSITTYDNKKFKIDTLDIFKCNNDIQNYYIDTGLITIFKDSLDKLYLVHSLSKVGQLVGVSMSFSKKKKLINYFINLIEIKYGDFINNNYYKYKKKNSILFGPRMNIIEKIFLDDDLRGNTNFQDVKEKILNLTKK